MKLLSELTNDRFHATAGTRQLPDDPRRTRIGHVGPQLGVREYWQYDPTGDYLDPPLQALQLIERNYWPLRSPGGSSLHSGVLGLDLRLEEGVLRFYDPHTGEKLRSHLETEQARLEAEQARLEAEQARLEAETNALREMTLRQAAEARLAELEARLQGMSRSD